MIIIHIEDQDKTPLEEFIKEISANIKEETQMIVKLMKMKLK